MLSASKVYAYGQLNCKPGVRVARPSTPRGADHPKTKTRVPKSKKRRKGSFDLSLALGEHSAVRDHVKAPLCFYPQNHFISGKCARSTERDWLGEEEGTKRRREREREGTRRRGVKKSFAVKLLRKNYRRGKKGKKGRMT